jgi:flavin reductase (NADH)/flavin reductase
MGVMPNATPALRSQFVDAFRRRADTVCVVTYLDRDDRPCGMTATAVCSVSADPPMLSVCLNRSTRTFDAIDSRGRFGVNVLSGQQELVAARCSVPGEDKGLDPSWLDERPRDESPKLEAAVAYLDCDVVAAHEHGTHAVVIGLVRTAEVVPRRHPLVYFDGGFEQLEVTARNPRAEIWWVA